MGRGGGRMKTEVDMFKTIVVAVDGSTHAMKALEAAIDLARKYDAKLELVSVYRHHSIMENTHSLVRTREGLPDPTSAMKAFAQEIVDVALKTTKEEHGFTNAEGHVRRGQPARMIVEFAKECGADAIVMGSRGLGDMTGMLLGSVSHKVSSLATCTTITVK